jgi:hypothetical protein
MKYLIVDQSAIEALNVFEKKKITPVQIKSNNWVVSADLLTDSTTWGFAIEYLLTCIEVELTEDDFIKWEL